MKTGILIAFAAVLIVACDGAQPSDSQSADMAGQAAYDGGTTGSSSQPGSSPPTVSKRVQNESEFSGRGVAGGQASQPGPPAGGAPGAAEIAPSMLIRTGQASIEVEQLDPAIVRLRQLTAQLGGYVANSSISGGRDQVRSATLELKIPAARYDQAVNGLGGVGKVEAVNTSVEDVGEEYVDITARVTNARRLENDSSASSLRAPENSRMCSPSNGNWRVFGRRSSATKEGFDFSVPEPRSVRSLSRCMSRRHCLGRIPGRTRSLRR